MLLAIVLLSTSLLFVSGQSEQNASTTGGQVTAEKAIETIFLIGIILSPLSFIISVVALWVAMKNRRKVYEIKSGVK